MPIFPIVLEFCVLFVYLFVYLIVCIVSIILERCSWCHSVLDNQSIQPIRHLAFSVLNLSIDLNCLNCQLSQLSQLSQLLQTFLLISTVLN